jgi:hypothetical protein
MPDAVAGIRCTPRRVKSRLASLLRLVAALSLVLSTAAWGSLGAETNSPPPASSSIEETNSQMLFHAYLQLEEQLRATQVAIEQNRREIKEAATQNAEALSRALQTIQESFAAQRARDLEAMQRSNRVILIVVGTFAAMGFLTLVMMSYFQWRMSKGLAEISAVVPVALGLGAGSAVGSLGPPGQSHLRLPGAVEQDEKRGLEPQQNSRPALKPREGTNRSIENRLFPDHGTSFRKRQIRPLRTAVIVGLICAAALALLLYMVTWGKLGFGYLHDMFKS